MRGVFTIATFSRIPVQIHWSFGLLGFWVLYIGTTSGMDILGMVWLAVFILSMFVCVVCHEFGHALSARRYGVETKDIILSPIGGIARLERLPEKPLQEFVVAIAGPLVNVVIAMFIGIALYFFPPSNMTIFDGEIRTLFSNTSNFFPLLLGLNLTLFAFNLLPAFPMDGGRIFRSLLSLKFGRLTATRIASFVGQLMAILFVVYGVYSGDFIIGFIGIFVFLMARQEYKMVKTESLLNDHKVGDISRSNFTKVFVDDPMQQSIDLIKQGVEKNFLVFNNEGQVCGVLYEKNILEAIKSESGEQPINEFFNRQYETVRPENSLRAAYFKMENYGYNILPVIENGDIVGVIDIFSLNNYIELQHKIG